MGSIRTVMGSSMRGSVTAVGSVKTSSEQSAVTGLMMTVTASWTRRAVGLVSSVWRAAALNPARTANVPLHRAV
jgi:hypothetical protein